MRSSQSRPHSPIPAPPHVRDILLNAKRVDTTRRIYSSIVPLTIVPFACGYSPPHRLLAEAKPRDELLVALRILTTEVSQMPPTLANQLQQAPSR